MPNTSSMRCLPGIRYCVASVAVSAAVEDRYILTEEVCSKARFRWLLRTREIKQDHYVLTGISSDFCWPFTLKLPRIFTRSSERRPRSFETFAVAAFGANVGAGE